ncbi:MAG: hypothetical protein KKF27_21630 [Gammaproteobacteria bacterium]|nr:hypothetical protein [Gammaproteobacteria bacterium]
MDAIAEVIRSQFGTDDIKQVIGKKSTEPQERVFVTNVSKRVSVPVDEAIKLFKAAKIEYKPGMENRILERTMTDETVDRYGDIVEAKGGDFSEYKKNPVLLAFHNSRAFPIGAVIKLWREGTATIGWLFFMDNDLDPTGISDTAFRMAAAGILKAGSIGFIPKEIEEPDDKKRAKLQMGKFGVIFLKWELVEFSVCPVPANPNALSFGDIRQKDIYSLDAARDILSIYSEETASKITDILEEDQYGEKIIADDNFEMVNDELTEKPYPNEHAARLRSPGLFNPDTFRRKKDGTIYGTKKVPATAAVIWGKLKSADKPADNPVPQAIRFPTKDWTVEQAKKWLKDNSISFVKFEPAAKDAEPEAPDNGAGEQAEVSPVAAEPVIVELSAESQESINVLINKATLLVDKLDILVDALKGCVPDTGLPGGENDLYKDILNAGESLRATVASIGNGG